MSLMEEVDRRRCDRSHPSVPIAYVLRLVEGVDGEQASRLVHDLNNLAVAIRDEAEAYAK